MQRHRNEFSSSSGCLSKQAVQGERGQVFFLFVCYFKLLHALGDGCTTLEEEVLADKIEYRCYVDDTQTCPFKKKKKKHRTRQISLLFCPSETELSPAKWKKKI